MLNVGAIKEGFVLDHIKAGMSLSIYHDLKLDELDCCVAIIKNAKSNKMGKKDIIKVECSVDMLDLDILGFIDECYELLHVSSYACALEDVEEILKANGVNVCKS